MAGKESAEFAEQEGHDTCYLSGESDVWKVGVEDSACTLESLRCVGTSGRSEFGGMIS